MTIAEIIDVIISNGFTSLEKKAGFKYYQKCIEDIEIIITLDLVTETLYISGEKFCGEVTYITKAYATFKELLTERHVDSCLKSSIEKTINALNEKGELNDKTKNRSKLI
nr:hypothetical protein [Clostridioides sp.]